MQKNTHIGSLQLEILEHLALNPNSLIKPTATTLQKDYRNVNDTFHILEKKGLIERGSKVKTSQKGEYDGFKLTWKGEAYVLAYGSEKIIFDALKTEIDLPSYKDFQQTMSLLDRKTAIKVLRLTGKLSLSSEKTPPFALMMQLFLSGLFDFSQSELKSLIKVAIDVESLREDLSKIHEALGKLLNQKGEKA